MASYINTSDERISALYDAITFYSRFSLKSKGKNTKDGLFTLEATRCFGGCINGGGQPIVQARDILKFDIIKLRSKELYGIDKHAFTPISHMNLAVRRLYDEYLSQLGAHDTHDLPYTQYKIREPYSK
ncbi:MAG: iron hydrogenase small subunit [Acholeplasmataceae bacterium]|nr:iron hydrogenase small subunit [Acholeplasmataceae bacterium]